MKDKTAENTPTLSSKMIKHNNPTGFFEYEDVKEFIRRVLDEIDRTIFGGLDFEQNKFVHKSIREIVKRNAGDELLK